MSGPSPERGLLDTSVVIDLEAIDSAQLPQRVGISALTLAELVRGSAIAVDPDVRARRLERLQRIEAGFEPIEFDAACARAFGRICAAVVAADRQATRNRGIDLMIASTALANDLALYTLNASDLRGLEDLIDIVDLAG